MWHTHTVTHTHDISHKKVYQQMHTPIQYIVFIHLTQMHFTCIKLYDPFPWYSQSRFLQKFWISDRLFTFGVTFRVGEMDLAHELGNRIQKVEPLHNRVQRINCGHVIWGKLNLISRDGSVNVEYFGRETPKLCGPFLASKNHNILYRFPKWWLNQLDSRKGNMSSLIEAQSYDVCEQCFNSCSEHWGLVPHRTSRTMWWEPGGP